VAEEYHTPFDRWLAEPKQDSPWCLLGNDEIQLLDGGEAANVEEEVGDGEA
jgi:hypothetical protein